MKSMAGIAALAALVGATTACAPRREPPRPQPPVQQAPQARPPQPLPPPAPAPGWEDAPLTRGAWFYGSDASGSQASFGAPQSEAIFLLRCDRAARRITLSREGAATAGQMAIRTSTNVRALPAGVRTEPLAYTSATLPASDPLLDAIAFSRGRFAVEAAGLPRLVLPAWPETARVVEDCRS